MIQLPTKHHTHFANHVYHHETGLKLSLDKLISGPGKEIWNASLSKIRGRLAQGVRKDRASGKYLKDTNTIGFIRRSQVLTDTKVTYANLIWDIKPLKIEKYRVRMTVGGKI